MGDGASQADAPTKNGSGPPVALIKGDGEGHPDAMAMVSISHDGDYATAVCLGFNAEWPTTPDG